MRSNRITLIIYAITSLILSRSVFFFIDDPEGPNLLIVVGMALVIYLLSLSLYLYKLSERTVLKQTIFLITLQVIISSILYLSMNYF